MPDSLVKKKKFSSKNDALRTQIEIKGANGNNLKNVDLTIPKNQLVVFTGVSGSGKSSLTMDTLYAEGQRRYVESLSSYARQFLMRMKKPEVDYIKGICPAIAIEQRVGTRNARSTVGTLTEIYDFLRLLYARIGKTYSPVSNKEVKRHQVSDVVDYIHSFKEGTKVQLFIPLSQKYKDRTLQTELNLLMQKGYSRILFKQKLTQIEDIVSQNILDLDKTVDSYAKAGIRILIDRFVVKQEDEENVKRIGDSVMTAFQESEGACYVDVIDKKEKYFNNRFELDGITFLDPTPQLFNFNSSFGACPKCEGYGRVMGIDEQKVVPIPSKSVYDGAIACWKGEKYGEWLKQFLREAHKFDFPVHTPYEELSKKQRRLLWTGNDRFWGIDQFFAELQEKIYKIQNRVMLARYRGRTRCPNCEGGRLREEATYIKIDGIDITELVNKPISDLHEHFKKVKLDKSQATIAKRLLLEVNTRLEFMINVGLRYLTLDRLSSTLSGGETQRINLTRTLGSNLTSSMYILDEPSVGLHPRDSARLVKVLEKLRDLGNTVIVVEHEEDIIKAADYLIDIGPAAGIHGGEVVFAGPYKDIYKDAKQSLTTLYMNGKMSIPVPDGRRKFSNSIRIKGAKENNLQNIDVTFPLNTFTVVTGVSGSGKTTLVKQILYPAMQKALAAPYAISPGAHDAIEGDIKRIDVVEMINQSAIGKSSRSNPATYVKAYDAIRSLFTSQQLAKIRGYKPKHFSFNVDGGRCETCSGDGEQVIEMQFLADIKLECEECKGKRFKREILEIQFNGKNIDDVLNLSVDEALVFFAEQKDIVSKIKALSDVGLGYIKLGQASSTLSGGEAQRIKLASFLGKDRVKDKIFFIFDEPTTGLHFHDIRKLLEALNALVEKGHTVLVVEHNMEVIKSADWIIDLGPEGGEHGGELLFEGVPEDLVKVKKSFTGQFLKEKL
jgi:excinuclease ABC subunit A